MGMFELTVSVACITAVVAIMIVVMKKRGNNNRESAIQLDKGKVLENAFGSHMYSDTVKLEQVTTWVMQRKKFLNDGAKALVMKATSNNLRKIGVTTKLNNSDENYLVIAIITETKSEIKDSILIKYRILDEQLEEALANGDGMLVING